MKIYDLEKNGLKTSKYHNTDGELSHLKINSKNYDKIMKNNIALRIKIDVIQMIKTL